MNRRSFFTKLGLAAATLAILPAATTYARNWVAPTVVSPLWIPNPEWVDAPFEVAYTVAGHMTVLTGEMPEHVWPRYRYKLDPKHPFRSMIPVPPFIQSQP